MATDTISIPGTVTTLTPIHVGSGDSWSPLNLWRRGNEILVYDPTKIYETIPEIHRERYLAMFADRDANLTDIIKTLNLTLRPEDAIEKYAVPPNWVNRGSIRRIITTSGNPYLPGSSVKGTLRTALLDAWIVQGANIDIAEKIIGEELRHLQDRYRNRPIPARDLKNFGESLEQRVFGASPNESVMRYVTVRDSLPADRSILTVELIRSELLGDAPASLPSTEYLEVIPPKQTFKLDILADLRMRATPPAIVSSIFPTLTPGGIIKKFRDACNARAAYLLAMELEFYKNTDMPLLAAQVESLQKEVAEGQDRSWYFPMGFCTGYVAITIGLRLQEHAGCWSNPCLDLHECNPRKVNKVFCQIKDFLQIDPNPQGETHHKVDFPVTRRLIIRNGAPASILGWCKFTPQTTG